MTARESLLDVSQRIVDGEYIDMAQADKDMTNALIAALDEAHAGLMAYLDNILDNK